MIKDSGERRSFASGAVRDVSVGKGRMDLLPLREVADLLDSRVIELVANYVESGEECYLYDAITVFQESSDAPMEELILDLSKHFEAGCLKYGEPKPESGYLSNWQLGIPLHCYIDSGVRHYLKHLSGHTDERHDMSFVWNLLCCVWTQRNRPEMIDLPFAGKKVTKTEVEKFKPSDVIEVKRAAEVGDWIKVVEDTRTYAGTSFKTGDIVQIVAFGLMPSVPAKEDKEWFGFRLNEYVVLEGYEPEKGGVTNA